MSTGVAFLGCLYEVTRVVTGKDALPRDTDGLINHACEVLRESDGMTKGVFSDNPRPPNEIVVHWRSNSGPFKEKIENPANFPERTRKWHNPRHYYIYFRKLL